MSSLQELMEIVDPDPARRQTDQVGRVKDILQQLHDMTTMHFRGSVLNLLD